MLLYPWDSPGKNIGMGCRALLQGVFPDKWVRVKSCFSPKHWLQIFIEIKGKIPCFYKVFRIIPSSDPWLTPWKSLTLFLGIRNVSYLQVFIEEDKKNAFSLLFAFIITLWKTDFFSLDSLYLIWKRQLQCHLAWKTENNLVVDFRHEKYQCHLLKIKVWNVNNHWKYNIKVKIRKFQICDLDFILPLK